MQRYLLNVSYIGTQFRGVQKIIYDKERYKPDWTTIQGVLELGLGGLKSVNYPYVVSSSRTDAGVHALHSTFHVDLTRRKNEIYEPIALTVVLNKFFVKNNLHLRVINTNLVPNTFHCRFNAKSRTYLYRIAVLKPEFITEYGTHLIPIEELNRCYFISYKNFDLDKMKDVVPLFMGKHDFRTFMGRGSHLMEKVTRRSLDKFELFSGGASGCFQIDFCEKYDYLNVVVKSEGFLYNQVRRIVGTLIAAGEGKLDHSDITYMLQVPSHLSWNPRITLAPSYGLYLSQVEYDSHDLKTFK